jgi:hypothetical protein
LDGAALLTIMAVGETVELQDGPPTSGRWTPVTTVFVAGSDQPLRVGLTYAWQDGRIQRAAPELLLPADAPSELLQKARSEYRSRPIASDPEPSRALEPGPGVVRCIKRLIARTRFGFVAVRFAPGDLVRTDSWPARQWPDHFEPSVR